MGLCLGVVRLDDCPVKKPRRQRRAKKTLESRTILTHSPRPLSETPRASQPPTPIPEEPEEHREPEKPGRVVLQTPPRRTREPTATPLPVLISPISPPWKWQEKAEQEALAEHAEEEEEEEEEGHTEDDEDSEDCDSVTVGITDVTDSYTAYTPEDHASALNEWLEVLWSTTSDPTLPRPTGRVRALARHFEEMGMGEERLKRMGKWTEPEPPQVDTDSSIVTETDPLELSTASASALPSTPPTTTKASLDVASPTTSVTDSDPSARLQIPTAAPASE